MPRSSSWFSSDALGKRERKRFLVYVGSSSSFLLAGWFAETFCLRDLRGRHPHAVSSSSSSSSTSSSHVRALSAIEIRRRCRLRRRGVNVTRNELGCITRGDRELKADSCRLTLADARVKIIDSWIHVDRITSGILSSSCLITSPAFRYELSRECVQLGPIALRKSHAAGVAARAPR